MTFWVGLEDAAFHLSPTCNFRGASVKDVKATKQCSSIWHDGTRGPLLQLSEMAPEVGPFRKGGF